MNKQFLQFHFVCVSLHLINIKYQIDFIKRECYPTSLSVAIHMRLRLVYAMKQNGHGRT